MTANIPAKINVASLLEPISHYLQRPLRLFRDYDAENLRPDMMAGLTVAVILLPQAIAFATIAELPPQAGLYTAIVGAIFGALWGSSEQIFTGPTNAISILVLSALAGIIPPGTAEFVIAAGVMAVMVGVFQLVMGLARLGLLVNFVSHSVIVGFATGAGILIGIKQIDPLFKLSYPAENVLETLYGVAVNIGDAHLATMALGIGTMVAIILMQRFTPRLPSALISMILASIVVFVFNLDEAGVAVIGELPQSLPPPADLPLFDLQLITRLSAGALAVGSIGLVQTMAIARSISAQTGQRLDSNQEFVGQGLANIASGLFSGYPCSGSFSVTAVNFKAGARSPLASIFASLFVLISMLALAPLAAYLPRAALAGALILIAYGMIDWKELSRIWNGARGDAVIMMITLVGTLFLDLEFAVLAGILISFAHYIMRTSTPRVQAVLPDDSFRHLTHQPQGDHCPQLGILEILGDLYFGAVNHVEEEILGHADRHPNQRFLVIRMNHVNHCDFSGIHMLETVVKSYRDRGGDVFLVRVEDHIRRLMATTGFVDYLGEENFIPEDDVIGHIFYRVLDPAICIYECPVRAFRECQNLPKRVDLVDIPLDGQISHESVITISPQRLWQQMHNGGNGERPYIVDVREPREFQQGHIPGAELVPLPDLLQTDVRLPNDRPIVLVCRGGRRSRRGAQALQEMGCMNVSVVEGGMVAWEASGLLEAVEMG